MKNLNISFIVFILAFLAGTFGGLISSHLIPKEENDVTSSLHQASHSPQNMEDLQTTITQLAEAVNPSVVSIVIKKDLPLFQENPFGFFRKNLGSIETEIGGGTGFFVDNNGTIITNKHVVRDQNANYSVILNNGDSYDAKILGTDPVNDLALIQIEYESTPMQLRSKNDEIKIGQFVIAVGNALTEFQNSVSFGVVSGKERIIRAAGENLSSLIQTDTAINPGNSGGPLINISGEVIGINTAIASNGQGLGFSIALSSEKVAYMLDSINTYGEIKKPFIGIYYIPINKLIAEEISSPYSYGIYVPEESDAVIKGTAAEKAGILPGDIILSINGQKITAERTLDIILQNSFPGEQLQLDVYSIETKKEKKLNLILGKD